MEGQRFEYKHVNIPDHHHTTDAMELQLEVWERQHCIWWK